MKMRLSILFIFIPVFMISCAGLKTTDPAEPIEVKVGEEFIIILGSNPSTGYHWEIIEPLDQNIVKFLEKDYQPDAFSQGAAGAGGNDIWKFQAIAAGQTDIQMGCFHPYDSELLEPSPAVTFHVIVK